MRLKQAVFGIFCIHAKILRIFSQIFILIPPIKLLSDTMLPGSFTAMQFVWAIVWISVFIVLVILYKMAFRQKKMREEIGAETKTPARRRNRKTRR
jgi:hypothetical protein